MAKLSGLGDMKRILTYVMSNAFPATREKKKENLNK
jgi:hypothetical protein